MPVVDRENQGRVLRLPVYLKAKAEGNRSRLGKQRLSEGVVGEVGCMTCTLRVKLDCLNSNSDLVNVHTHR
jgi:hypothetical protein